MAGTTTSSTGFLGHVGSFLRSLVINFNKAVDDVEVLRAAVHSVVHVQHEELAAGVDISARPCFVAPAAITVTSCLYIPAANSAGVDAGNTLVLTLRNITEGADIATVTRGAGGDLVANTPVTVTLQAANVDCAANDVIGFTVTQGAAADVAVNGVFQFTYKYQTVDAAADMTAAKIGRSGTAVTA